MPASYRFEHTKNDMKYHLIAFIIGMTADLIIGDPHGFPHPIRLIGRFIAFLEKKLNTDDREKAFRRGVFTAVFVPLVSGLLSAAVIVAAYHVNVIAGVAAEAILTYYIMAARSLYDESMKVYRYLEAGDTEGARAAVSMIVGRDTASLTDEGITKAAVETVAENTSDGVIAPMIYTAIGGPVLGYIYKAINTMDSMIGYKNERYMYFGRAAAKLDDAVNYIPSRVSAYLMMAACLFLGKEYNAGMAFFIHKRDSKKHASPNSAQTESTCAGALGIRLAGDASYFGKVHKKPYIGDAGRRIEYKDIKRSNLLMFAAAFICAIMCSAVLFVLIRVL